MQVGEKWMRWTLLEAASKTVSKLLQKVVGVAASDWAHAMFATAVIGAVQVIAGLAAVQVRGKSLWPNLRQVAGSTLFGLLAFVSTVLSFAVFAFNGDIGVNTFIITLSIVPGALIDWLFFSHKLNSRQWVGVVIAILAGYAVLGFPSLSVLLAQPLWVWLSLVTTMTVAAGQGVTQAIKKVDPLVENFWGGLTTLILAGFGLVAVDSLGLLWNFSERMQKLWLVSGLIGVVVIGMWSFNLLSYKGGARIALKKLVMNGVYLTAAMIGGMLFFAEPATWGKGGGTLLFIASFVMLDNASWQMMCSMVLRLRVPSVHPTV